MIATVAETIAAVGAVGGTIAYAIVAPTAALFGSVHSCAATAQNGVYALTFDDGPTPGSTNATLDILAQLNVPAAFFAIGASAQKHPDLLQRIHNEGHLIGNHSFSHHHFGLFGGRNYWLREIQKTDEIIEQIIGQRPKFFRPPMGVKTPWLMSAAKRTGHHVITWSKRAVDGIPTKPQKILRRLNGATPGDILLLHDGTEPHGRRDPSATLQALRPLITRLNDRGLTPIPLDQLLNLPAYATKPEAHLAATP